MKLFQYGREFYEILEVLPNPNQPDQRCAFTIKNLSIIAGISLLFSSSSAFFLFKAKNAEEHAYSFFVSMSVLTCLIQFLSVIWKLPHIFKTTRKFEQFIEKRKH